VTVSCFLSGFCSPAKLHFHLPIPMVQIHIRKQAYQIIPDNPYEFSRNALWQGPDPTRVNTYTISSMSDNTGCTVPGTGLAEITINQLPAATAGTGGAICSVSTLSLSESGGDAVSWSWSSDGAAVFSDATAQNPTATGAVNGEVFTVQVTDGNGCQSTDNVAATVNTTPTITLGANPSVCAGTTAADLPYSATTGSPDQYSIDFDAAAEGAGFIDVTNAVLGASPISLTVPGGAAAATYDATLTITNSTTGCLSGGDAIEVIVNDAITASASVSTAITCNVGTGEVTITASGGTAPLSYTFDGTTNATGVFTGVSAGMGYAWSVTDANSCGPVSGTIDVTEPTALSLALSSQTNVSCNGLSDGAIDITVSGTYHRRCEWPIRGHV